MGTKDRKERDRQKIRRLILDTAKKLFLEDGFDNVTVRHIAEKIEYSPAAIYLYFKNKDEILYELHAEGFEELFKRMQAIRNIKDPLKRLKKHADIYISFGLENPEYYNLMFIMRSPAKMIKEVKQWEIGLHSYDFFKKNVKYCMDAKVMRKANLEAAAFSLWSFTHGIVSLIIRERCIMIPDSRIPALIKGAVNFMLDCIQKDAK